ncbi:MAG TPA: DUF4129 domain-containing protein [Acidimicrobiales bacterium]|nr:DUF4129 domain-containing protein [Acidimicrobiales bacterium]
MRAPETGVRRWSLAHNVATPAVLVAVEAGWLSVFLGALATVGPGGRARLAYLALALPAVLAVAIVGGSARLEVRRGIRLGLALALATGGMVLTGLALTSLLDGSIVSWLGHPFAVAGRPVQGEETLALFAAVIAWARGLWLGWEEPGPAQVTYSVGIAALAFLVFFLADAARRHAAGFRAETLPACVLLLVCAPASLAAIALVNERELERWRLRRASARPNVAWLAAVMVPLLAVAVVALLVALAGGPLRPVVDTVVRDVLRAIGALIAALARLLGSHLHVHLAPRRSTVQQRSVGLPRLRLVTGHARTPWWVTAIAVCIVAVVGVVVLVLLAVVLRRLLARLRLPTRVERGGGEEDSDSVFSWAHLLDQLMAAIGRLLRRRRVPRRRAQALAAAGTAGLGATAGEQPEAASVRLHYRRVLASARRVGQGRAPAETPLELSGRLAGLARLGEGEAATTLARLTAIYDVARYAVDPDEGGGPEIGEAEIALAGRCADLVCEGLEAGAAGEGLEAGAAGKGLGAGAAGLP